MFTTLATCNDVRSQMISIEAKYFPGSNYYDRLTFAIEVVEAANLDEWLKEAFEVEPRGAGKGDRSIYGPRVRLQLCVSWSPSVADRGLQAEFRSGLIDPVVRTERASPIDAATE
mgnify:FL=1